MRGLALLMVALLLPGLSPGSAAAEPMACSKRTDLLSRLAETFKESPVAVGLASNGGLLEVLTTGTGSTWTIILTMPNGISCLVAAGEDWRTRAQVAAEEGPEI